MLFEKDGGDANRQGDKAEERAELFADLANLEDVDFVSLDGVEVVVHGQEDLRGSRGNIGY